MQSTKGLRIATRCKTLEQFVDSFHRYCEDSAIFIPQRCRTLGAVTAFSFDLAGGESVLAGIGAVVEEFTTAENRFGRVGIVIQLEKLGRGSAAVFARVLAARKATRAKSDTDQMPPPLPSRTETGQITLDDEITAVGETPVAALAESPRPKPTEGGGRARTILGLPLVSSLPVPVVAKPGAVATPAGGPATTAPFRLPARVPAVAVPTKVPAIAARPQAPVVITPLKPIVVEAPPKSRVADAVPQPHQSHGDTVREALPYGLDRARGTAMRAAVTGAARVQPVTPVVTTPMPAAVVPPATKATKALPAVHAPPRIDPEPVTRPFASPHVAPTAIANPNATPSASPPQLDASPVADIPVATIHDAPPDAIGDDEWSPLPALAVSAPSAAAPASILRPAAHIETLPADATGDDEPSSAPAIAITTPIAVAPTSILRPNGRVDALQSGALVAPPNRAMRWARALATLTLLFVSSTAVTLIVLEGPLATTSLERQPMAGSPDDRTRLPGTSDSAPNEPAPIERTAVDPTSAVVPAAAMASDPVEPAAVDGVSTAVTPTVAIASTSVELLAPVDSAPAPPRTAAPAPAPKKVAPVKRRPRPVQKRVPPKKSAAPCSDLDCL